MRDELDKELCERFPKIFANRNGDVTETAMVWGFECGDGWHPIIFSLCSNIQIHLDWINRNGVVVEQVVADQVKEKFGGLRFYYTGGDSTIMGFVTMAESWAAQTCEVCGAPGRLRGRGWIYTACDTHTKPEHLEL